MIATLSASAASRDDRVRRVGFIELGYIGDTSVETARLNRLRQPLIMHSTCNLQTPPTFHGLENHLIVTGAISLGPHGQHGTA